ncbi:Ti-type conjugative transfer relaxase TraA [Sphingomonas koreensis]
MAIYHFSVKIISRASGRSAVAAAAYRSALRLHDERLDRDHDFTNKSGVVHSEILLPEKAPEQFADREKLWNAVEATEKRKDAQLSREVEFAIPRELDQAEGIELAREFVQREFVDHGMIADLNVHWDIGPDGLARPHAHVMLTMRKIGEDGFGAKVRDWNRTDLLEQWRERWAEHVNQRLTELDINARVDHRSLEAQGIDLEPQHKIGPVASRLAAQGLVSERLQEHHTIARTNGEKLLANPALALDAITHTQATFTARDLAMFVHRHSEGKEQFDSLMAAVKAAPELVALGKDGHGEPRFTSRNMIEIERRLERATFRLEASRRPGMDEQQRKLALARAEMRGLVLSSEQRSAFHHVTEGCGLGVIVGYAGTGKSAMLGVARDAWESAGYSVRGVALSGIAADNLEAGSAIASRTIASLEHQWAQGRELLSNRDVLVIDEAGMIGTRQMERVLSEAEKRGAKVVMVGDPEQLQAIEAGAAFRATAERHGSIEITEIRRQREDWQRNATRYLATGRTVEAISAYSRHECIHVADTRNDARADLIERWDNDRSVAPDASRIILTHTNEEVQALNAAARNRLRASGDLGDEVTVSTERGERAFAPGDRIMFLRNERGLGVKNGSLGQVQSVTQARMAVLLDDGRVITFDVKDYANIDHGYAATVHKAQGVTVDRVHVLATPGLDRHAAYVALSRHRDRLDLHYGRDHFSDQRSLTKVLSRERGKDMVSDYPAPKPTPERQAPDNRFAELKLSATPSVPELNPFEQSVVRVARSVTDILRMRTEGYPELPHQRAALDKAVVQMEAVRPGVRRDLQNVFNADRRTIEEAANGRPERAIQAMVLEAEMRADPAKRADQFVTRWHKLQKRSDRAYVVGDMANHRAIRSEMAGMAKSLERDPQMESILAARKAQLGITIDTGRRLGAELAFNHGIDLGRGRGLGR